MATYHAEKCVMSHQSLSRQAKTKSESPTAVEFGSRSPKSDHGSCENVQVNLLVYFLWRIPRLSLIQYSLYVGVVENSPPLPTYRGAVQKYGTEIAWGWSVQECFMSSVGL